MLLNHLRQTKQGFSKDLTITSLSRAQPLQDQHHTSLPRNSIQRQEPLENVTEMNSTFNGLTQTTEPHEDGCLVVGKNINARSSKRPKIPPAKPNQIRQNWRRNSSITRIREKFRQAAHDEAETKPIFGLPIDSTNGLDPRFSPFHEQGIVFNGDNRTVSVDIPRFQMNTPQKEENKNSRGHRAKTAMKERRVNHQSKSQIDIEIAKLHKPSYPPPLSANKELEGARLSKNASERPPLPQIGSLFEPRKEKGSVSPHLSPNSRQTPGRNERSMSPIETEELPKEGSLLKYFRAQSTRPKSSANYRQVIQAKQAMYEILALEEQESSMVKGKRMSLAHYMTATKSGFRRGTSTGGRRTISCDNTIDNAMVEMNNKSVKAPSSIDVFSEKVKKYMDEKNEAIGMRGLDDESFLISFLKNEYSSIVSRIEKDEKVLGSIKGIDMEITPFSIEEPKSPMKLQKGRADMSPRKGVKSERVSSQDGLKMMKVAEADENTEVKDLDELLVYVRQRNTFVEESIRKVDEERERKKWGGRLVDTMIEKIKEKGGMGQKLIRSSYGVSTRFEKDIEEVKDVRGKMDEVEREMKFMMIEKEKQWNETRMKLEKAKFVSPNRLTNSELDFVREQFMNKSPEDMHIEKIDDLLKRLKFFGQLSRGVRTSFYKCAKYIKEQKGHYIFHQGDVGDLMYIILRGSVSVKVPKRLKDGSCQFVTVASLYDGSHFGELAIMLVKPKPKPKEEVEKKSPRKSKIQDHRKSKRTLEIKGPNQEVKEEKPKVQSENPQSILEQKRSASIQCAEETEMLTMSRDKFQEILLLVMNTDMDMKIRLLQLTPFYNKESNFTLMPVANNMKGLRYRLGQKIVQAGDVLMNFYIIAKGTCKVIEEIEEEYVYDTTIYQGKLRNLKYKEFIDPNEMVEDNWEEENERKKKQCSTPNPLERTFDYGLPKDQEKNASPLPDSGKNKGKKFIKHVVFREMIVGDFFGFRPLLRPESDAKYKQLRESKAKLSVVAYSTEVEIFALPRASLLYLPEKVKSTLLDGIAKMKDFDDIDIREHIKEQNEWRKFQLDLVEETLVNPEHPNLRRPRDNYKAR